MKTPMGIDFIRKEVADWVVAYPTRQGVTAWWRAPLLVSATIDERFKVLPEIVAPDHLLPLDLLKTARSVIVYFLPFKRALVEENSHGKFPVRNWSLAYNDTNTLIEHINRRLAEILAEAGYRSATTPPTANFDKATLMSRWSHKHLGYLAGLGRFGINAQLITPEGCAGRLGSLVTEVPLSDHPVNDGREACLHKQGLTCLHCVEICPVKAVSVEGIDRQRCYTRIKTAQKKEHLADLPDDSDTCGKCQAMLPCSFAPANAQSASAAVPH